MILLLTHFLMLGVEGVRNSIPLRILELETVRWRCRSWADGNENITCVSATDLVGLGGAWLMNAATMDSPVSIPEPDSASQLAMAVPAIWVFPVDAQKEQCEVCALCGVADPQRGRRNGLRQAPLASFKPTSHVGYFFLREK